MKYWDALYSKQTFCHDPQTETLQRCQQRNVCRV